MKGHYNFSGEARNKTPKKPKDTGNFSTKKRSGLAHHTFSGASKTKR